MYRILAFTVLLLGFCALSAIADIDPDLVAWYEFEEGTGTTTADSTEHGLTGTLYNMTSSDWVTGKEGGALDFDGGNDYVRVSHNSILNITSELTLAAWIYWRGGTGNRITFKEDELGMWLTETPTSRLGFYGSWNGGGSQYIYITNTSVQTNEWTHVAITYSSTEGKLKAYINAIHEGTYTRSGTLGTNSYDLTIGNRLDMARGFDAIIDEVRIYKRALTEGELAKLPGFGIPPGVAVNPTPVDEANDLSPTQTLSWTAGDYAQAINGHDIYFGTNFNEVNDANASDTMGIYRGSQNLSNVSYYPDRQTLGTTYYWRIDEVNDAVPYIWKGLVWSFTTGDPDPAYNPDPSDGVDGVALDKTLDWKPGRWTQSNNVYFGTDPGSMTQVGYHQGSSCTPPTMDTNETYYWRVDEYDGLDTWTGTLWNFTTELPYAQGDLTKDRYVGFPDLAMLVAHWLDTCPTPIDCEGADITPPGGDGTVNSKDYATLTSDWSPRPVIKPYPDDDMTPIYEKAADYILDEAINPNRGYCMVYGAGRGRLAYELAKNTEFTLIGIEEDGSEVTAGRNALDAADVYGDRITLHNDSLSSLDYSDYVSSLVVSDSIIEKGICSGSAAEMYRMAKPQGGLIIIGQPVGCPNSLSRSTLESWLNAGGLSYTITEDANGLWAQIIRGPLAGASDWSHVWGDAANTGCSGDTRTTNSRDILWFGEPGPSIVEDTHRKVTSPLYKAGKLITMCDNGKYVCSDAYNGARLWDLTISGSGRTCAQRSSGGVAMDDNFLYVAGQDDCHKIALETGEIVATYHPPTADRDWGYLAVVDDLLIGSEQIIGASYIGGSTGSSTVTSKALFCRNKNTDSLLWTYSNSSVIADPAICVSDDAVYFLETYYSGAVGDSDGRVGLSTFTSGDNEYLVKLNKTTGAFQWRVQKNLAMSHILYLSYANGIVLASGCSTISENFWYHHYAFNSSNGSIAWEKTFDSGQNISSYWGSHSGQEKHPILISNNVYLKFGSYNLQTGASLNWTFTSSDCSDFTASANHIFGRSGKRASIYRLDAGSGTNGSVFCSETRPGCFVSIIPAGGLILLPPYNSGCTCDFSLQTTLCWLPK